MRETLKLSIILTLYTLITAGALAFVNSKTAPIIAENIRKASSIEAMSDVYRELLPGSNGYEEVAEGTDIRLIRALKDGQEVGFLFVTSGQGYSSVVRTLVGVDTKGVILGTQVIAQQETPGIGTQVMEKVLGKDVTWVEDEFIGKSPSSDIHLSVEGGEIDAITGATVTSAAVTNSVREALLIFAKMVNIEANAGHDSETIFRELVPEAEYFEEDPAGKDIGLVRAMKDDRELSCVIEAVAALDSRNYRILLCVSGENRITGIRVATPIKEGDPAAAIFEIPSGKNSSWLEKILIGKSLHDVITAAAEGGNIEILPGMEEASKAVTEAVQLTLIQFTYIKDSMP